jgi:hypothetical protein
MVANASPLGSAVKVPVRLSTRLPAGSVATLQDSGAPAPLEPPLLLLEDVELPPPFEEQPKGAIVKAMTSVRDRFEVQITCTLVPFPPPDRMGKKKRSSSGRCERLGRA